MKFLVLLLNQNSTEAPAKCQFELRLLLAVVMYALRG